MVLVLRNVDVHEVDGTGFVVVYVGCGTGGILRIVHFLHAMTFLRLWNTKKLNDYMVFLL